MDVIVDADVELLLYLDCSLCRAATSFALVQCSWLIAGRVDAVGVALEIS